MLREISFQQLLEWEVFDRQNPIGGKRGDWQAAAICAAFMNGVALQMRSRKRFRVADFMLEFGEIAKEVVEKKPGQSWQQMKFLARMLTAESKIPTARKRRR